MGEKNFEEMELKDILMVVWKRRVLLSIVAAVTILVGALGTIILPKEAYQAETIIEVSGTDSSLNIGSSNDQSIQNMLNEMIKPLDISFNTYVDDLLEEDVLEKTISDLELQDKYDVGSFKSNLKVEPDEESQTIRIVFSSLDPKEPVKVLNSYIDNFTEYITEKAKTDSEEILSTIKEQTEVEKQKYEKTFETYESFINENKSVDEFEIEKESMYKQIIDFKTDLKNLEIKEQGIRAAIKENESSPGSSGGSILQIDGNAGSSIYLGDTKRSLEINLAEVTEMIKATTNTIDSLEEEIKQINIGYQRAEIEAIAINQKLEISKESYESLAKTYETIQTISKFDKGKLSIIKLTEPKEVSGTGTSTKLKLLILIVMGIVFGILSTFIKAFLDYKKGKNKITP